MAVESTPTIGDWFQYTNGDSFEVVATDLARGHIEVQHFDGTIEEIDMDSWNEQMFIPIEPPEDWSGSLDIEKQDYGVDTEESSHLHWENPLDTFDY